MAWIGFYRLLYQLSRQWNETAPHVGFVRVGLNPSDDDFLSFLCSFFFNVNTNTGDEV